MKKILTAVLAFAMIFGLTACGDKAPTTFEVAMVTDVGTIDDKSFNQATWEGVEAYCTENDVTYKYYQPTEESNAARMEQIDNAVANGAKVVVTPGFLFNNVIFEAQAKYTDVKFIFIDGVPQDPKDETGSTVVVADNTIAISFAEQEPGYLAGYAAVKDGYRKLGFMGGISVPAVVRYGYGFVAGAEAAAKELKLDDVEVKYNYTMTFNASPDVQTKAAAWYEDGTEVIFACGGGICSSIDTAADAAGGKVIGVDSDQSYISERFITSAMKNLNTAVEKELANVYGDTFDGGKALILGAKEDTVGLPMENSIWTNFTQEDYDKVYADVKAGKVEIPTDADAKDVTELDVEAIKVKLIK